METKQNETGRPHVDIIWEQVEQWIKYGANGVQVAAKIGVCPDTLYRRCLEEKKMTFTAYSQIHRSVGDYDLLEAQFLKAVKSKDVSMLKWLGEHRLGQKSTNLKEFADALNGWQRNIVQNEQRKLESTLHSGATGESSVSSEQFVLDQERSRSESQIQPELGSE